jgi:DNA-directed RNA polymerase subunit omega
MLVQPPIEDLLPKAESRYTLAMLVAKRTRQLVDGGQPMVPEDSPNLVTLSCEEIMADKVVGVVGIHNPFVPLRPEIEEARRLAREMAENQASMDVFPDLIDFPAKRPIEVDSEETVDEDTDVKTDDDEEADIEDVEPDEIDPEEITDDPIEDILKDIPEEEPAEDTDDDISDLLAIDGSESEEEE